MSPLELIVLLLWIALWTVLGGVLGKGKGRTWTGIVLGCFLTFIGVIIIAVLEPTDEERRRRAALSNPALASPEDSYGAAQAVRTARRQVEDAVPRVSRQEAVAEALRRDPSLGDTNSPDGLRRLAESVAQVQEELELKVHVEKIRAAEKAQTAREEKERQDALLAANVKAFQEAGPARREAARVAAEQEARAARAVAE